MIQFAGASLLTLTLLSACAGAETPSAKDGSGQARMVSLRSRAVTQVALTVASSEDAKGTTVTLLATIDGRAQAAPAGIVTFSARGKRIGEAAVTNGSATLTTQNLPAGLSTLTATYGGDSNFMPSQSATVRFYLDDEKN